MRGRRGEIATQARGNSHNTQFQKEVVRITLVRWEPRGVLDLRDDIDRIFNRFWRRQEPGEALPTTASYPTVDIAEREDTYEVRSDLPGVTRDDVKVKITNNVLTLSGQRKSEKKEGADGESYHRVERTYGSFTRSFSLPSPVDESEITATYQNGVLTVALPKCKTALPREIKVN